jgi:hypothetical protein
VGAHAAVARIDLLALGSGVEAGAPVDDPVTTRVDRDKADAVRKRRGQGAAHADAALPAQTGGLEQARDAEASEQPQGPRLDADQRMDREWVQMGRAERHDARYQVRTPHRESAGEKAAPALSDDCDAARLAGGELLEPGGKPLDRRLAAVGVQPDARPLGAVSRTAEPGRHQAQRVVPGEEAGYEEDRLPAAVGNGLAPENGMTQERGDLQRQPGLPPDRPRCQAPGGGH